MNRSLHPSLEIQMINIFLSVSWRIKNKATDAENKDKDIKWGRGGWIGIELDIYTREVKALVAQLCLTLCDYVHYYV